MSKEYKLEYNKSLRTICIRFKNKLFCPEDCQHPTLHIEGKYLKFMVCNFCGKRWERQVSYSQNTRSTLFKSINPKR